MIDLVWVECPDGLVLVEGSKTKRCWVGLVPDTIKAKAFIRMEHSCRYTYGVMASTGCMNYFSVELPGKTEEQIKNVQALVNSVYKGMP